MGAGKYILGGALIYFLLKEKQQSQQTKTEKQLLIEQILTKYTNVSSSSYDPSFPYTYETLYPLSMKNLEMILQNGFLSTHGSPTGETESGTLINGIDHHAINEAMLFADNTRRLYDQKLNIHNSLQKKIDRGVFDQKKSGKAFENWFTNAVRPSYKKEFGVDLKLNKQEKEIFGEYYAQQFVDEYANF